MAKVDIAAIEKEAAKIQEKKEASEIIERVIGGRKYFKGPFSDDWFDDYGDCHSANESIKRVSDFKNQGLDEFGRTPAQKSYLDAKAKLLSKRQDLLNKISEIDGEIRSLKVSDFEVKEVKKEKKK